MEMYFAKCTGLIHYFIATLVDISGGRTFHAEPHFNVMQLLDIKASDGALVQDLQHTCPAEEDSRHHKLQRFYARNINVSCESL